MITRRTLVGGLLAVPAWGNPALARKMGLQLYSLREEAKRDLDGTLALISKLGFRDLEVSPEYAKDASEFRRLLDKHRLKAVSCTAEYADLLKSVGAISDYAHTLGASYVVCSTIPHSGKYLAAEDCAPAALRLNQWGEVLKKANLQCCYHTHGTEFKPSGPGTVFDNLARLVNPAFANFEMDIFWIVYGGQDPVAMLRKYPGRFPLMHVKDIRRGTRLGLTPADVREEDSVPIGQGIVDVAAALRAGAQTGTKHFFIEDEAVNAAEQLPLSLSYLAKLP